MDNSTHCHPFERDDYPFPGQCVAIINPKSEAKAKRCGKVASAFVANLFPVCTRHIEYLDAETFSAAANGRLLAQAERIEELEVSVRQERGSAAEWRRLALAKHGEAARDAYRPVLAKDSFVYFVQGGDYIKIGKADNPATRFAQLQLGGVIMPEGVKPSNIKMVGIERGGHERERELHGKFSRTRIAGEWFRADQPLVEYIRALPEIYSPQWGDMLRVEPI